MIEIVNVLVDAWVEFEKEEPLERVSIRVCILTLKFSHTFV